MNGTTFFEKDTMHRDMHHGFYIDIMCLNNVPNNKLLKIIQFIRSKLIVAKTLRQRGYITKSKLKKVYMWIADKFITDKRKMKLIRQVRKYNNLNTNYVGHLFGRAKYKNSYYKSVLFLKQKYVKFEDVSLPVMEGYHEYLTNRFGSEYMKMPNMKTRNQYPDHAYFADSFKDYKEIDIIKIQGKKENEK